MTNELFKFSKSKTKQACRQARKQPHPDHEEELNSEDLLLPWSCCVAQFLAEEEEKERKLNEPEALANTIRHRLMAKNQVIIYKKMLEY